MFSSVEEAHYLVSVLVEVLIHLLGPLRIGAGGNDHLGALFCNGCGKGGAAFIVLVGYHDLMHILFQQPLCLSEVGALTEVKPA